MLKAKRLKSMFVLYSACAVMATGFTSQAASEQPEVTTITETKGENTNTHTAATGDITEYRSICTGDDRCKSAGNRR